MLRNSLIIVASTLASAFFAATSQAQLSSNPFPVPIEAEEGIIAVNAVDLFYWVYAHLTPPV
mgnify:CR=1 FL=1